MRMKTNFKTLSRILALLLALVFTLTACELDFLTGSTTTTTTQPTTTTTTTTATTTTTTENNGSNGDNLAEEFDFSLVPAYSKEVAPDGYYVVNNNIPFFTRDEMTTESFEIYEELDSLGRATLAYACLSKDTMPTSDRGSTSYNPTGWHSVSYPETGNQSLYNRSHLIAWSLAGEDNTKENLITGTQYFNQFTMQIFENMVLTYLRGNSAHVLYRVTPVFEGENLIATGVLMEAYSVEDGGEDIMFCVFVYNVQEGIIIDYKTGESERENGNVAGEKPDFDGTFYDFSGFASSGTATQYKNRTGTDGWNLTWARTDTQAWIGDVPQAILNGKTSAVGSLTSASLSGGITELYMNYGLTFADSKISFTVNILQNGEAVATKNVENLSAKKNEKYELHWVLDTAIEGDFVIQIVNNCPSNNASSNIDRLSVWNLGWK